MFDFALTLTFDALGDEAPEEVGTEVAPVRTLERVRLQNQPELFLRKFLFHRDGWAQ